MNETSKSNTVVVLIAGTDARGLLRFPTEGDVVAPGLHLPDGRTMTTSQLIIGIAEKCEDPVLRPHIVLEHTIDSAITLASGENIDLLVASIANKSYPIPNEWLTLPEILRSMPANKNRIAYLKAFQLFSGADKEKLEAVELDEKARERLKSKLEK